jgi:diguanylate cyclase (GGDEF)-like protein
VEHLKLLIIEDDADQRELMREILEDHFGRGTVVGVGSRAQAMDQDLGAFDLILADYNLPDSNGLELIDAIKRQCATPVIMVTGENVGQIAAQAIRKGATDYVVKVGDYLFTIPLVVEKNLTVAKLTRENELLRQELEETLWELRDKNTQLQESLQRLEQMAATDPLTGLYNRRHFSRVLDQLFAEANRYENDLSCVMVDLDGYKALNDAYGHQIGDQLLVVAAKAVSANLRRMDVAARYGGDEFVLLLPRADAREASLVAGRIRDEFVKVSSQVLHRDQGVTMSMGIGSLRTNRPPHADQLVALADAALYRAKEAGRDRIILSDARPDPAIVAATPAPSTADRRGAGPMEDEPDDEVARLLAQITLPSP